MFSDLLSDISLTCNDNEARVFYKVDKTGPSIYSFIQSLGTYYVLDLVLLMGICSCEQNNKVSAVVNLII